VVALGRLKGDKAKKRGGGQPGVKEVSGHMGMMRGRWPLNSKSAFLHRPPKGRRNGKPSAAKRSVAEMTRGGEKRKEILTIRR